jgi:DNA-binding transcriptional ArsR family regulator
MSKTNTPTKSDKVSKPVSKLEKGSRFDKVSLSIEVLRAFVHPLRLKMLSTISSYGSIFVKDIHTLLKLEQSLVSQHLRILRQSDLVVATRKGKFIYYSVNFDVVDEVIDSVYYFLDNNDLSELEDTDETDL